MYQISSPLTRDSCGDKSADTTTLSVRTISPVKDVAWNTYISTVDVAVQPGLRNNTDIHAALHQLCRKFIELFLDRSGVNHAETRKSARLRGLTSWLGDNSCTCSSKYRRNLCVISISRHAVLWYSEGMFFLSQSRLVKLFAYYKRWGQELLFQRSAWLHPRCWLEYLMLSM